MNDELIKSLMKVLSDTFVMYYKAHASHWNVEGPNFPQYHSLLGDIYNELFAAVDDIAEKIRQLGGYPSASLAELMSHTMVSENEGALSATDLLSNLLDSNNLVIASLYSNPIPSP